MFPVLRVSTLVGIVLLGEIILRVSRVSGDL